MVDRERMAYLFVDIVDSKMRLEEDERQAIASAWMMDSLHARLQDTGATSTSFTGDGLMAVYDDGADAIGVAADIRTWVANPSAAGFDAEPFDVRLAVHAGAVHLGPAGSHLGLAPTWAHEIMKAGHPGQILVSQAASDGSGPLRMGLSLIPIGWFRLAGSIQPVFLHEVVGPGLEPRGSVPGATRVPDGDADLWTAAVTRAGFRDAVDQLDEVVGVEEARRAVRTHLHTVWTLANAPTSDRFMPLDMDMVFIGRRGTGKSLLASVIARALHSVDLLASNEVVTVDSVEFSDLGSRQARTFLDDNRGGLLLFSGADALAEIVGTGSGGAGREAPYRELFGFLFEQRQRVALHLPRDRRPLFVLFTFETAESFERLKAWLPAFVELHGEPVVFSDLTAGEVVALFKRLLEEQGMRLTSGAERTAAQLVGSKAPAERNARYAFWLREFAVASQRVRLAEGGTAVTTRAWREIRPEDLVAGGEPARSSEALIDQLRAMTWLGSVPDDVDRLVALARRRQPGEGLPNIAISGAVGSGRSKVAGLIAGILAAEDVLRRPEVHDVRLGDLLAEYTGGSRENTAAAFERARGGALLIRDAHYLVPDRSNDRRFEQEVTLRLAELMATLNDEVMVILSGLPDGMERLLRSVPELGSAMSMRISIPALTPRMVPDVVDALLTGRDLQLTDGARTMLHSQLAHRVSTASFGSVRGVERVVDVAAASRDERVAAGVAGAAPVVDVVDVERALGLSKREQSDLVLAELEAMVGLEEVKEAFRSLAKDAEIEGQRRLAGLPVAPDGLHMVFLGNPGTGKTTVARLVGRLLHGFGLLERSDVVEASPETLVGHYRGETAIKTREVVDSALGGVLFVDEAYGLAPARNDDGYGGEALTELVAAMERHRGSLSVVFAGYHEQITSLIALNPGLRDRFSITLNFRDLTGDELLEVADQMATQRGLVLDDSARIAAVEAFDRMRTREHFGNARAVRKLLENARRAMSLRLAETVGAGPLTAAELSLLTGADIDRAAQWVLSDDDYTPDAGPGHGQPPTPGYV